MLAANTDYSSSEINKLLSANNFSRLFPNHLACPCLFVFVCQSIAVCISIGKFPQGFPQSEFEVDFNWYWYLSGRIGMFKCIDFNLFSSRLSDVARSTISKPKSSRKSPLDRATVSLMVFCKINEFNWICCITGNKLGSSQRLDLRWNLYIWTSFAKSTNY